MTLTLGDPILTGIVVDSNGNPVDRVIVSGPERFFTKADGKFAIHGYGHRGLMHVTFNKEGYRQGILRIEPGAKNVRIVLQ